MLARQWLRSLLALLMVLTLCGWGVARGQEPLPEEDRDLRDRVEELERHNRALLRALQRSGVLDEADDNATDQEQADLFHEIAAEKTGASDQPAASPGKAEAKAPVDEWYEVGSDLSMSAAWNNGLELTTKNKDFRVHIGGRTQFDGSLFSVPDQVNADPTLRHTIRDGVDFRRARLRIDGTLWDQVEFAAEYDFVNSIGANPALPGVENATAVTAITDLWWTYTKLPVVGNVRVGNQKEPIGFEHLTSSRYLNFMERSFNQDAFYGGFFNGFSPGIQAFNTYADERASWAIGVFKPGNNVFGYSNEPGLYSITGRLTWLPWLVDDGRGLLHVAASARQAGLENGYTRHRTRGPERSGLSTNWPIYADTGVLEGDSQQFYNFEVASVLGPWTFVGEYLFNFIHNAARPDRPTVGTVLYSGGYVEVLYFLTGEHREYRKLGGFFERITPHENFFCVDDDNGGVMGLGAWQVGARYNYLDLNDKGINGGILNDVTLGLNWFLNPNMKIQFNYSITDRQSILARHDGTIQGWGVRLAHDF